MSGCAWGNPSCPAYGGIYYSGTFATTLTLISTWYPLNANFVSNELLSMTMTAAGGRLTVQRPGLYSYEFQCSAYSSNGAGYYSLALFVNGVLTTTGALTTDYFASTNHHACMSVLAPLVRLSANDVVDIRGRCTSAAGRLLEVSNPGIVMFWLDD